ncbi:MAG: RnfABCDGE type electron transport complex subunit D [Spirochaetia bacterium]|nr:RnfABCDGE type electron transport complex subunit D [Spirochaetales bacterium]MDX9783636.1 RnfABCDGE type electron transport complex subunit D [Spirochaetia bacterium]
MPAKAMLLSSSPHSFTPVSTPKIMLSVLIALVPAAAYGVYLYGFSALALILVTMASAAAAEFVFRKLIKASTTVGDFSALVTGLLLALTLPPSTPLWMGALGAVFAIVVAKEFFGGLGANPFNPALIGRAFLLMSFPAAITTWTLPQGLIVGPDAVTAVTPLGLVKAGKTLADVGTYLGTHSDGELFRQLFLGYHSGSMGESSILLITLGGLFLLGIGVIQFVIPVAVLGSTFLFSWILGMNPLFSLLTGGIAFGAFFMATDYATRPLTPKGQIIFGIGIGLITAVIRKFGGFPEGVTYAILIMNIATPFLNKMRVKKYGFVPPAKPAKSSKEAAR